MQQSKLVNRRSHYSGCRYRKQTLRVLVNKEKCLVLTPTCSSDPGPHATFTVTVCCWYTDGHVI